MPDNLIRYVPERVKYTCVAIARSCGWLSQVDQRIIEKYLAVRRTGRSSVGTESRGKENTRELNSAAMTFEEFESFVNDELVFSRSMKRAAGEVIKVKERSIEAYGPVAMAAGMGALVILFPIVKRIVYRIGLPWLRTAERYSELWRQEVERWVDEEHERRGFDPAVSKAASEALLSELEQTTEKESRQAWERLMAFMRKDDEGQKSSG